MRAISDGRFTRPLAVRPDLPPPFEAVILKALANRPDDRFPTVHAMGRALLPFASPKGRMMWVDYFDRGQTPGLAGTQAQGFAPAAWPATMAVPGMLHGHPGMPAGDTRSGVRPVSVMGSNELLRRKGSGTRKAALLVLGLGAAAAIWLSMGDRKGLEEMKPGVTHAVTDDVKNGISGVQRPAGTAAARSSRRLPSNRRPPPRRRRPPRPTRPRTGMAETPVVPAKAGGDRGRHQREVECHRRGDRAGDVPPARGRDRSGQQAGRRCAHQAHPGHHARRQAVELRTRPALPRTVPPAIKPPARRPRPRPSWTSRCRPSAPTPSRRATPA